MTLEDFMRRAIELSARASPGAGDRPFGAVVVKDGQIVGEGLNETELRRDPTLHGEVAAIRDACEKLGTHDLSGCELYTSCEPCAMCVGAIYQAKIDRFYYAAGAEDAMPLGFASGELRADMGRPMSALSKPTEQLMAAEAMQVLSRWAKAGS